MIDLNRGCEIRIDLKTGRRVYMYKDDPGKFLDWHERIMPESIARSAGFDVKMLKQRAQHKRKLNAAIEKVNAEFADANPKEVLFEGGGYKVVAATKDYADIYDSGDIKVNTIQMKRKEAIEYVKLMSEEGVEDENLQPS